MRAQLGDATYWVAASFFSSQSGFLFFPEASIRTLDDPKADRLAIQPRYVVMTTERRGALDERVAADNRIGDTPFAVSWDESRLGWVVRRLSRSRGRSATILHARHTPASHRRPTLAIEAGSEPARIEEDTRCFDDGS